MSAWIGPRGSLVEFVKYKSDLSVAPADRSTFRLTLGGRRKEQRGPRGRREWSVSVEADSRESAGISALVDGFFGAPPWVWVDPYARVTNLLSPGAAVLNAGSYAGTGVTLGGAGVTSDGLRFGRSVNVTAGNAILFGYRDNQADYFPVVGGTQFAASFYGSGAGNARVDWFDANGVFISTVNGASSSGSWTRRTVTGTAPTNAAGGQLRSNGVSTGTLPCVTWTASVQPWAHGRGCNRVTVDGLSEAVQFASATDPSMRRSSISFTVVELG